MTCDKELKISHLHVQYGPHIIIPDLTLKPIYGGRITSLLGANGSGKSTLMRAIAGLIKSTGQISMNGERLTKKHFIKWAENCAYLPQTLPPMVHMQVLESIMVACRSGTLINMEEAMERSLKVLSNLDMIELTMRYLDELSGGQRQLVGLAQALVRMPKILLLDEPLSALDLSYQVSVMKALLKETRERQIITLLVVHDLNIALQYSDEVIFMRKGTCLKQGHVRDVTTSDILADVYDVSARVEKCSRGVPHIIVDDVI